MPLSCVQCTQSSLLLVFKAKFNQEFQIRKVFAHFVLILKPITHCSRLMRSNMSLKWADTFLQTKVDFLPASYFSVVMPLVLSSLIPRRHNRLALSASPA